MKTMKKMLALVATLAMILTMVMATGLTVFAADSSTPSITINSKADSAEASADTTVYTWYMIMEADITADPSNTGAAQESGEVAYYVTTQARANELNETNLFNVVRVGTTDKWYVELKDKTNTSAEDIANAFAASTFDLRVFPTGSFHQERVAGTATTGEVDAGYYYITSTAGTNAVIQTLKAVTIDEKNTFPTVAKAVDSTDANAQIGDEINYTLTVVIPETANDSIVLTDKMSGGLTFKSIDSVKSNAEGTPDVAYTANPTAADAVTANSNTFTVTFDAATVAANKGKTITIEYTAVLNYKAVVGTADTNEVKLDYGQHYSSVVKSVDTKTYSFDFDKVDGSEKTTKLTGAEFQLTLDGKTPINLIEVEAGKTYRVAMSEDTATPVTKITTTGETVTILGIDTDVTYKLVETKAPTGYNKLDAPIEVTASGGAFAHQDIENNKGAVLPSTGGIGTTIFYILGSALVIGCGIVLISRKRMQKK